MTTNPSRRKFLKTGCLVAAGTGLALCDGTALAATYQPPIDLPSTAYGPAASANRVLVAYASKAGSTAGIAARIAETLAQRGAAVDLRPAALVSDLAPYRAVVAGSAIRTGHLLPEMMSFIEKNQAALQQKPFSAFIACMTLAQDTPANRQTVSAYLDPLRALVRPASEGLFAGVMDLDRLPLFERLIILAMQAPRGDFRSWDAIRAWANSLPVG